MGNRRQILLLLMITSFSCYNKKQVNIDQLKWMVGTREVMNENGLIIETWEQENDSSLIGKSYMVTKGDTMLSETITVIKRNGTILYIPLVFDQNEGKPIVFELKSDDPERLVFENLDHDFPQRISYDKEGNNIHAWIEGDNKKIDFYYTEVKLK